MSRRTAIDLQGLEGRNRMSATLSIDHTTPAEIRGFDPQPDPPGRNDELIPTGQLHGAEVSATRDRMGREDLGFSWGV